MRLIDSLSHHSIPIWEYAFCLFSLSMNRQTISVHPVVFLLNSKSGHIVRLSPTKKGVENYFSILKRGITGNYQWVSARHLKRYLGEFDFRYNTRDVTDLERAALAAKGIAGKRLTYRRTGAGQASGAPLH